MLYTLFYLITILGPSPSDTNRHVVIDPKDIHWTPAGQGLALATLEGNPDRAGATYTILLRLAPGQWIQPHHHPNDKRIVVISGRLLMGMGSALDSAAARVLPAGGFVLVPAGSNHYEGAAGETVLLMSGMGPLKTIYVKSGRAGTTPN